MISVKLAWVTPAISTRNLWFWNGSFLWFDMLSVAPRDNKSERQIIIFF
jgi:hypothetical protein